MNTKAITSAVFVAAVVGGVVAAQDTQRAPAAQPTQTQTTQTQTIQTPTTKTQTTVTTTKTMRQTILTSTNLTWADAPPGLPVGAKMSVLNGDPTLPGPFTVRLKVPAGYRIAAHHHPTDENVTIIEGTMGVGMGDVLDIKKGTLMSVGSFVNLPKGHTHFVWAKTAAVVQLQSTGPFEIIYVNPADDPRNIVRATQQPTRSQPTQPMQY